MSILDWDRIRSAEVCLDPYPHFIAHQTLLESKTAHVSESFPNLPFAGLLPLQHVKNVGGFKALMDDLSSEAFSALMGEKFGMDLSNNVPLITVRARARMRDGRIHVDTPDKKISILLYLNDEWCTEGGCLRVLRNGTDLEDYVAEIPPVMGTMFVFKVTDNCWHGHAPIQAARRAVMLNYMSDQASYNKHLKKHCRSAVWKKVRHRLKIPV